VVLRFAWEPVAPCPYPEQPGAALTTGLPGVIYAFVGGGTKKFLKHNCANDQWDDASVADLPAEAVPVQAGGALTSDLRDHIYALVGGAAGSSGVTA